MPFVSSSLSFIFDLDGTLIDSLPGITTAIRHALRRCDIPVTSGQVRELIGPPIKDMLRKIVTTASEAEILLAEQDFRSIYDSDGWKETHLFSSTYETLQTLRELGVRLFLFTNKPEQIVNRIMSELDIGQFFVDRLCKDSRRPVFENKGEMLQALIAKHGLSKDACVVVGDSQEDLHAARQLSVRFVFATYGYGKLDPADRNMPTTHIDNLSALLAL